MKTLKKAPSERATNADTVRYDKTLRRDAAGKDGAIKHIIKHLSPRETRVVELGKPSDRDRSMWYFLRWAAHLPTRREFVLFNRNWYNRAGVEPVMGFCTKDEYHEFITTVPAFEDMLVCSGMKVLP
jgi:polyphosphate kinase